MHRTTINIPDRMWQTVQERASYHGVPAAQYIRDSVLALMFYELGRCGDEELGSIVDFVRRHR